MPRRFRSSSTGTPAFVQPFLHTLNQMRVQERLRPDQLVDRASALLVERFGTTPDTSEAAFAHGAIGLMSEHSHYFDGFALMMPLPLGTAVALRPAAEEIGSVVVEGSAPVLELDDDDASEPAFIVPALAERLGVGPVDAAVVSSISPVLPAARSAAIAVATGRALAALGSLALPADAMFEAMGDVLDRRLGRRFSRAYLQAASVTEQVTFALVDTANRELIGLNISPVERPGWAIVSAGDRSSVRSRVDRTAAAADVLRSLRERSFADLESLRDLEHRDLERALHDTPRRLRPALQYLVTENGRVQKLVAAVRRRDWQMFGALLLMSHASKKQDWHVDDARADYVVDMAEDMSLDGLYGAVQLGEGGGTVFVVGQPFSVPPFLEKLGPMFQDRYGREPDSILL